MTRREPTVVTVVKLTARQREALNRLAHAEDEPISAVVRALIRAEAQRRGLWPEPQQREQEVGDA